jgi:hypothetical protein
LNREWIDGIIDPAQNSETEKRQKQPQVPFGDAQGRLSTPLRSAQDDKLPKPNRIS